MVSTRSRWLAISCAGALALSGHDAVAQERERDIQLPMLGNGLYDVAFVGLSATAIFVGTSVLSPRRANVPPLDGLGHREHSPPLGLAADYSVMIGLGVGVGLSFMTEVGEGSKGGNLARAPLITAEGALAASAFTQLLKNAFGVCRPRDWDEPTRTCSPSERSESASSDEARQNEARRSFPSGHNAPLAGVAGAAIGMYVLPSNHRPEFLPVALTSTGFALTTVILREQAGAHSWVDTIAAFVTGGIAGFGTAALHIKTTKQSAGAAAPTPSPAMVTLGGAF
jgi:membrane-associated phospholipid phosphatase